MTKEIDLENIGTYIKALHCQIRWVLIDILRDGPKSSDEIFNHLKSVRENIDDNNQCHGMCGKGDFKNLKKPNLYYHLRELESVGIIKSDYKPSESKRAPEKVWKLNLEKLTINLK
ncbi:MAG: helix-turn-helix transcriptional regulator [Candidatus Lokiarchaeota archaeon]|nr:helix-turn-helix transcriptional regulator [Candidatus Lokiarchaeota archaeon]